MRTLTIVLLVLSPLAAIVGQTDSVQLLQFYEAFSTTGNPWMNNTGWANPDGITLEQWYGVLREDNGFVICLDLDGAIDGGAGTPDCPCAVFVASPLIRGNGLSTGQWPDGFRLNFLKRISLRYNFLNIVLPDLSFSFPRACEIQLNGCGLSGTLQSDLIDIETLRTLNLNSNGLAGNLPMDLAAALPNIEELYLNNNKFSGLVPGFPKEHPIVILDVSNNAFTFEDLLPFYGADSGFTFAYNNQDSIYVDTVIYVGQSLPYTFDLLVDDTVTSSKYTWYKERVELEVTTRNEFFIPAFSSLDSGTYNVKITNNKLENLTLYSRSITFSPCMPGIQSIDTTLCPGQQLSFNEGLTGDLSLVNDTLLVFRDAAANTCDSAVDVRISYFELGSPTFFDTLICDGTSLTLGGNIFNSAGEYEIQLVDQNGCDSLVNLKLTLADEEFVLATTTFSDTIICDPFVTLSGNLPTGTEGQWRFPAGMEAMIENDSTLVILDLPSTDPQGLTWLIGATGCAPSDSADVTIQYEPPVDIITDTINIFYNTDSPLEEEFDLLPYSQGLERLINTYTFVLLNSATEGSGSITLSSEGILRYSRKPGFNGLFEMKYQVVSEYCESIPGSIWINVLAEFDCDDPPPNVITPNGDGYNDRFILPRIECNLEGFPESHFIVTNRDNQVVFEQRNYKNNWFGKDGAGMLLPGGEYFYRIDYGNEFSNDFGFILIIRK